MTEFQQLTADIEALRASANIPGVAVAIVKDNHIVYSNGFGQHNDKTLSPETQLEVASLSKPVFAYTVLKLCEQGILDLDRPLSSYLPEPYAPDEMGFSRITARHTLSHSSGLPNWRDADGLRPLFTPGSAFTYSTEGLIYLQTVIEQLIEQPFHEYVQSHLFEPFGMHNSQFLPADMRGFPDFLPRHLYSFGGVSLQTTAADYGRFLIHMMDNEAGDEFHITKTSRNDMLQPHIQVGDWDDLSWGLGWGLEQMEDGIRSFWHWGQRQAQTRNFAFGLPEQKLGIVILTNYVDGLNICEPIIQKITSQQRAYSAFRWLLPAKQWRGDGRKIG
jgi:CubicO group peptidase (beta-lactamase class C family)